MVSSFITLSIFYFGGTNLESQPEDRQPCLPIFRSFSTNMLEYWLTYYFTSSFLILTNSSFTTKHRLMLQNLRRCKSMLNKQRFTRVNNTTSANRLVILPQFSLYPPNMGYVCNY